jgi:hypothetical protein
MNEARHEPPAETQKTFICEICGPEKPANQVFQCTVCVKDYCVVHIGSWVHNCYDHKQKPCSDRENKQRF